MIVDHLMAEQTEETKCRDAHDDRAEAEDIEAAAYQQTDTRSHPHTGGCCQTFHACPDRKNHATGQKADPLNDRGGDARRVDTGFATVASAGQEHTEHHEQRCPLADERVGAQPRGFVIEFAFESQNRPSEKRQANSSQRFPL